MKKLSLALLFGRSGARQTKVAASPRARRMRLERLETRELLSVSSGFAFQAPNEPNVRGHISGGFSVDDAIAAKAAYEARATAGNDAVDLTGPNLAPLASEIPEIPVVASALEIPAPKIPAAETTITVEGLSGPGEPDVYFDADKSVTNTEDDELCWAATASNMLWYTGWASVTSAQNEQEIFDSYFVNAWPDDAGNASAAISWFLNNEFLFHRTGGGFVSSPVAVESAGLYSRLMAQYEESAADYVAYYGGSQENVLSILASGLAEDSAVGLAIAIPAGGGHAITCWGYAVDESYSSTDPRYYAGLYITDSDDERKYDDELNERKLVYVGIEWSDTLKATKDSDVEGGYYLNYAGRTGTNRYYLRGFDVLAQRPDKYAVTLDDAETPSTVVTTANDVVDLFDNKISLREAINYAAEGDAITFDQSLQGATIALDPTRGELAFNKSLTIDASNLANTTTAELGLVVDGQAQTRILNVKPGKTVVVDGVEFTNGRTTQISNYSTYEEYLGGAIYVAGNIELNNCKITNSTTTRVAGGAMSVPKGATATLVNCEISGNDAGSGLGGGITCFKGTTTLVNCTITNNKASTGGGIFVQAGTLESYNTIVGGNTTTGATKDVGVAGTGNVVKAYNTLSSYDSWTEGANNLTYDAERPLFTDAAAGDFTLAPDSQAIDQGDVAYVTTSVDLAGRARVSNGAVDLGAYEFQKPGPIALDAPVVFYAVDGTTITATWEGVEGAASYRLMYKPIGGSYVVVNLDSSTTTYAIADLDPNTKYALKVAAIGDGTNSLSSPYSTLTAVTTAQSPTYLPPLLTWETAKTETSVTLAWNGRDDAALYVVCYKKATDSAYSLVRLDPDVKSYTITGLDNSATYNWRLRVFSNVPLKDESSSLRTITLRQKLETPTVSYEAKPTSITVAWNPIEGASSYRIMYKPAGASYVVVDVDDSATSYEIVGLDDNSKYSLKVAAIGNGFDYASSQYSPLTAVTTPKLPETLASPTNPREIAKSASSITVAWDPVENAAGYKLIYKESTAPSYTILKLGPAKTSYKIPNLDGSSKYWWKVLALGNGDAYLNSPYTATKVVRPSQKLDAPTVSYEPASNSIALSWTPVDNAAAYRVMYKRSGEAYVTINVAADVAEYVVGNLAAGTCYAIKIAAIGDGFDYASSAYSPLTAVKTAPAASAAILADPERLQSDEWFEELEDDLDLLAQNLIFV